MTTDRAPLPAGVDGLPPLPSAAEFALRDGLVGLGLDDLPESARVALRDHLRLLLAWTVAVNLTAVREPVAAVRSLTLDALAAVPVLRAAGVEAFLDLGSGGGLPGIPLAVALPARAALLVESVAKKARFLAAAVAVAGLTDRVSVAAGRAETLAADPGHRERWPAVTARALAPLPDLIELAFPLLAPGGLLLAWKSAGQLDERRRALAAVAALGGGTIEVIPAGLAHAPAHVLVAVRKVGRSAGRWPRPPAERRRHPWQAPGQPRGPSRPLLR